MRSVAKSKDNDKGTKIEAAEGRGATGEGQLINTRERHVEVRLMSEAKEG